MLSHVQLSVTPWAIAYRLLCPQNFPGKTIGAGCHFLLQGIELTYLRSPALAGRFFTISATLDAQNNLSLSPFI